MHFTRSACGAALILALVIAVTAGRADARPTDLYQGTLSAATGEQVGGVDLRVINGLDGKPRGATLGVWGLELACDDGIGRELSSGGRLARVGPRTFDADTYDVFDGQRLTTSMRARLIHHGRRAVGYVQVLIVPIAGTVCSTPGAVRWTAHRMP
jgi:hypothetical protein